MLVAALGLVGIVVVAADGQPLVAPDASDSLDLGTTWRAVLIVVVGALVGAAVVGRRLRAKETGPGGSTTGVRAALETSLVELELGSDPRAAIVAAYARLLEAFERCGVERTAAETPLEHLQRGLASVPIRPGPAQELTALFLEARFSTHPLGESERERALSAFRAARDDLAGHEPVAIGPRVGVGTGAGGLQ